MTSPAIPMSRRRGRMSIYALWQLRDYLMDRGLPTLLVLLVFGYLGVAPAMRSMGMMLERIMTATPANLSRLPDGVKISKIAHEQGMDAARQYMMISFTQGFLPTILATSVFLG
ncbi:MAG: hypothetical protein JWM95_4896, partial [Gemmatimonadetes bacterium]|nr:hypothetical protein [Gemmatimonadota bacterium]